MERQEVLVHISAASAFRDDKRYAMLAAQLAAFEIAALTHVYGLDNSLEHKTRSCESAQPSISPGLSASVVETLTSRQPSSWAPASAISPGAYIPGVSTPSSWNPPVHDATPVRSRHLHRPRANPPYKNSFGKPASAHRSAFSDFQTPEMSRSKTAPAGGPSTLQVPTTGPVPRKRTLSESSSFGSLISTIPDSQPFVRTEDSLSIRSSPRDVDMSTADDPSPAANSESSYYHANLETPARKRRRLTGLNAVESKISRICNIPRPDSVDGPFFPRDRSLDWTSPAEASASEPSQSSLSSTLSPSQPLPLRLSQSRTSLIPRSPSPPIEPNSQVTEQSYKGKGRAIAVVSRNDPEDTPSTNHCSHPVSTLARLPALIEPSQPLSTLGPFVTHVTENLSAIVKRLPLEKWFRPVEVMRDIANIERGHWSMRVCISSDEDVARVRKELPEQGTIDVREREVTGATASERLRSFRQLQTASAKAVELERKGSTTRYALWTEQEMKQFWQNLSTFVGDGNAGWGIRVTRDWEEEALTPGRVKELTYARIRIFTWGEVVGHVWLALWVLSDKKTSFVPMAWIAADDQVVVRMSGNRQKGGHLGTWRRKGPPGEKGTWGIVTEAS